jgi:hypothetical protein
MKIDQSHRKWLALSVAILAASAAGYSYSVTHGAGRVVGPSGGSAWGLTFGILAAAFMLFAGLLGGRKRFRTWRIGRAEFWMRGHLWLGTLCLPLIWFHAGFRHGGTLTTALMWLTYAIVFSGLVGAALQHFVPRAMTSAVPDETIYEQIPQVMRHLQSEAGDVIAICGPTNGEDLEQWRAQRGALLRARAGKAVMTEERRDQLMANLKVAPAPGSGPLREFYGTYVEPFVAGPTRRSLLASERKAQALFEQRRLSLPVELHDPLADLQRICDEARQLAVQRRMHHLLHGWLMVHIPLSAALLVLGVLHVVVALRYAL